MHRDAATDPSLLQLLAAIAPPSLVPNAPKQNRLQCDQYKSRLVRVTGKNAHMGVMGDQTCRISTSDRSWIFINSLDAACKIRHQDIINEELGRTYSKLATNLDVHVSTRQSGWYQLLIWVFKGLVMIAF
jgi:hypothetical protein